MSDNDKSVLKHIEALLADADRETLQKAHDLVGTKLGISPVDNPPTEPDEGSFGTVLTDDDEAVQAMPELSTDDDKQPGDDSKPAV
jgi:hypothetical protein